MLNDKPPRGLCCGAPIPHTASPPLPSLPCLSVISFPVFPPYRRRRTGRRRVARDRVRAREIGTYFLSFSAQQPNNQPATAGRSNIQVFISRHIHSPPFPSFPSFAAFPSFPPFPFPPCSLVSLGPLVSLEILPAVPKPIPGTERV